MTTWRDRGYVGDSDEEEEDDSNDSDVQPDKHESAPNHYTGSSERVDSDISSFNVGKYDSSSDPNAEIDELQQDHSFNSFHDTRTSCINPKTQDSARGEGFPSSTVVSGTHVRLSQQRECFIVPPPVQPDFEEIPPPSSRGEIPSSPLASLDGVLTTIAREEGPEDSAEIQHQLSRNFRRRNPIQLHPYLLENEQYRNSLRARGLQPVAIANHGQQTEGPNRVKSSDLLKDVASHDFPSSPHSSRSSNLSPLPDVDSDLELPLVDQQSSTLSQQSPSVGSPLTQDWELVGQPPLKRLKTYHETEHTLSQADDHEPRQENDDLATSDTSEIIELPAHPEPSSPVHRESRRKRTLKKFQVPRAFRKQNLPTPDPPSDTIRTPAIPVNRHAGEHDNEQNTRKIDEHTFPITPGASSGSASRQSIKSASPQRANDIKNTDLEQSKRAARRLKGVLPASWIRLDKQAQKPPPVRRKSTPDGENTTLFSAPRRGVAYRVDRNSNGSRQPVQPLDTIAISEDENDSLASGSDQDISVQRNSPLDPTDSSTLAPGMDVEVSDWVDPMLPKSHRKRRQTTNRKNRRHKYDSSSFIGNDTAVSPINRDKKGSKSHSAGTQLGNSKIHGSVHRKHRAAQKRSANLSVLDAPTLSANSSEPDFIRVAARRARSRRNYGRHSPSRKLMSFHFSNDQENAIEPLQQWETGKLRPKHQPSRFPNNMERARPPLRQQSINLRAEQSTNKTTNGPYDQREKWTHSTAKSPISPRQARKQNPRQGRLYAALKPPNMKSDLHQTSPSKVEFPYRKYLNTENSFRPGQLEETQGRERTNTGDSRSLTAGNQRRQNLANEFQPMMDRFLDIDSHKLSSISKSQSPPQERTSRLSRKRRPRQLDIFTSRATILKRVPEPSQVTLDARPPQERDGRVDEGDRLSSIPQNEHSSTFGLKSFDIGTCFHSDSFLGSNQFHTALATQDRDLEVDSSTLTFRIKGKTYHWCSWNDKVQEELKDLMLSILNLVNSVEAIPADNSINHHLPSLGSIRLDFQNILQYFAQAISYYDPSSRCSSVEFTCNRLLEITDAAKSVSKSWRRLDKSGYIRTLTYVAVVAWQLSVIANHNAVDAKVNSKTKRLVLIVTQQLGIAIGDMGISQLFKAVQRVQSETVIPKSEVELEAIVILWHLSTNTHISEFDFWRVLDSGFFPSSRDDEVIDHQLEQHWRYVFSVLPLLRFNSHGMIDSRSIRVSATENNILLKNTLNRTLELYLCSSPDETANFNPYIRVIILRCHHLMEYWRWQNIELPVGLIFDFFAKRGLALLKNENTRGSPTFLEHLHAHPLLDPEPQDCSFNIFLKLLAKMLLKSQETYSNKKLKNLAWRFVPNHGRNHVKEHELAIEDLDVIRNHHNLLCVLYWASPSGHRINVDLVKDLVDFRTSHLELCRVNLRAWINLARFHLSFDEELEEWESLSRWFKSMIEHLLTQHRQAKTEAEAVQGSFGNTVASYSKTFIENITISNQRQIEGLLHTALGSMALLLGNAKSRCSALSCFENSIMSDVLATFRPQETRLHPIFQQILDIYRVYMNRLCIQTCDEPRNNEEESQDYGDWIGFEEVYQSVDDSSAHFNFENQVSDAVRALLSDCFGCEMAVEESLLESLVSTWVLSCQVQIKKSCSDWTYYLEAQSPGSWNSLRDTLNTRKYGPYYYNAILRLDPEAFYQNSTAILSHWLSCLVEPHYLMRYQHLLTETLVANYAGHRLLQDISSQAYAKINGVAPENIRSQSLLIISSVLANMRNALEDTYFAESERDDNLRHNYNEILTQLMSHMKRNYLEMDSDQTHRVEYVKFVQEIVEYLQQYTTEICPVDKFFTDSSAFPLPEADPTYVVARMKSYQAKLAEYRTQKMLVIFIQTTCSRAVVEGQQDYLTNQLFQASNDSFETENFDHPTLRIFLMTTVFPSYIELALSTECSWILVSPILRTVERVIDEIVYCFQLYQENVRGRISSSLSSIITATVTTMNEGALDPASIANAHVQIVLTACFKVISSCLPVIDYLQRLTGAVDELVHQIKYVEGFAKFTQELFNETNRPGSTPSPPETRLQGDATFPEIRAFCRQELQETLEKGWTQHDGDIYAVRGNTRRKIKIQAGSPAEETTRLLKTVDDFLSTLQCFPLFVKIRGKLSK